MRKVVRDERLGTVEKRLRLVLELRVARVRGHERARGPPPGRSGDADEGEPRALVAGEPNRLGERLRGCGRVVDRDQDAAEHRSSFRSSITILDVIEKVTRPIPEFPRSVSADVHVPSRPRGRPRRAAARAAIVRATLELLGEGGFQAATMDAIAARAGVGKNTIYRRWDSKDAIADALVELGSELDPTKEGDPYELLLEHLRDQEREFADPRVGGSSPGSWASSRATPSSPLPGPTVSSGRAATRSSSSSPTHGSAGGSATTSTSSWWRTSSSARRSSGSCSRSARRRWPSATRTISSRRSGAGSRATS